MTLEGSRQGFLGIGGSTHAEREVLCEAVIDLTRTQLKKAKSV